MLTPAKGMSSKPVTVRSRGTSSPRSYASWSTPMARTSVAATMAVGGSGSSSRAPSACAPLWYSLVTETTEPSGMSRPCAATWARKASSLSRISPSRRPPMNAIRRCPSPRMWSRTASIPARLSTVTVGRPAAREPCHSATTGTRVSWRSSMSWSWSRMSPSSRIASQWRASRMPHRASASSARPCAWPNTTLYPRREASMETASMADAKNGSVISRTITPRSPVRAPRRPRASGLGR